jgi:hypothetical protein
MKNYYESPEFEIKRVVLTEDVLTISEGEKTSDPIGFIVDPEPGDDMIEEDV